MIAVENLSLTYATPQGPLQALRGVSLQAGAGEVVGIIGESGCGKSSLALALPMLLPANARVRSGRVLLDGRDVVALSERERRAVRGPGIAMVFQDPMTAFNPVLTIGRQLVDAQGSLALTAGERQRRALAMLAKVGLADPSVVMRRYVHELSGGMRQRVGIAAALMLSPKVLVADEPTTALDVTMEAQILHLLRELRRDHHGVILVVTHHLSVVGELCDRVLVMYAGEVVEEAPVDALFHAPRHPYTQALMACDPAVLSGRVSPLPTIPGRLPDLVTPPPGCAFAARCPIATPRCQREPPPRVVVSPGHSALCHEVVR
ncbi:ABC transporter ATP-binding protein [Tabrizicola sp.]|uniref:ABC transporter ATP-binding protein n=1 Tax=Tabrizicola sp. TaxID=2005166 RepID=UPI003F2AA75A